MSFSTYDASGNTAQIKLHILKLRPLIVQKCTKNAMASFQLKSWKVMFSRNIEKYIPNERRDQMHSFGI